MPQPFRIAIPDDAIRDLHTRLQSARRPSGVLNSGGIPLTTVDELVRTWLDDFDWRSQEAALNELPQFTVIIRGVRLHFVHIRSGRPPLLLLHGWPGSFVEFRHVIPLLANDFDLVVPSLPGYGFSTLPHAGFSNLEIAGVMADLMSMLSYDTFGVQGGDWGAGIATWLARKHAPRLRGLHLNYIPGSYAPFVAGEPTSEERAFLQNEQAWRWESGGYSHIQITRPLTLGYGLSDSPIGLGAWIHEMFVEWSDPATRPTFDDILTNISLYWFTNSIASSMRLYLESTKTPHRFAEGERVSVPAAIFRTAHEAPFPPRSWIERAYDIRSWTDTLQGGHFAALEVPEALAEDVRTVFE